MIRLKELRQKQGLSQAEMAAKALISQPSYANIENGKRRPCVETAKRIASVLGFEWPLLYDEPLNKTPTQ